MPFIIVMPALEMAQDNWLVSWLDQGGETIKGRALLGVETEKAVLEIEFPWGIHNRA